MAEKHNIPNPENSRTPTAIPEIAGTNTEQRHSDKLSDYQRIREL